MLTRIARPRVALFKSAIACAPKQRTGIVAASFHSNARQNKELSGFKHVDTPDNNEETPFDFLPELWGRVNEILAKYPPQNRQSGVLPLLHLTQEQTGGWIPLNAMKKIAEICNTHERKVYEVVTFYTMFNTQPVGKYHLLVCLTTCCMVRGADEILRALEKHLNISLNGTTEDKMFTIGEMECMGCCVNAPMICVADYSDPPNYSYDYYEDLTVERTIEIVESLKKGIKPPKGPQNGRRFAMPKDGRTSLFEPPKGPYCRDLDKE